MSNLVYGWEWPRWREFYLQLTRFSRLILFDKRGTGLSDYTGAFPTLETRMEDLRAVLDAAGSQRGRARCTGGLRDGLAVRGDVPRAHRRADPLPAVRHRGRRPS